MKVSLRALFLAWAVICILAVTYGTWFRKPDPLVEIDVDLGNEVSVLLDGKRVGVTPCRINLSRVPLNLSELVIATPGGVLVSRTGFNAPKKCLISFEPDALHAESEIEGGKVVALIRDVTKSSQNDRDYRLSISIAPKGDRALATAKKLSSTRMESVTVQVSVDKEWAGRFPSALKLGLQSRDTGRAISFRHPDPVWSELNGRFEAEIEISRSFIPPNGRWLGGTVRQSDGSKGIAIKECFLE